MLAQIVLVQTAAGPDYIAMLDATDQLHRDFCGANDATFLRYTGVRRGYYPWQASFNRIEMLHDLLSDGFMGWALYLDADAVIRQLDFDLQWYLGKRADYAIIAAPGTPSAERWDINNGVFFLNLGHELGQIICRRWRDSFYRLVTDKMLQEAVEPWQSLPDGRTFPDDQHLLQMVLRSDSLSEAILVEKGGLINFGNGRFIKQIMRHSGTLAARLALIRHVVKLARGDDS